MMMEYRTPTMNYSRLYAEMLGAGHTLIAGAQGSGKSTVMAGLIHTALKDSPAVCKLVICDPKRVDMVEYSQLPHVERYATTPKQIAEALRYSLAVMEARYNDMAKRRLKEYDGAVLYVILDEVADLMTDATNKRTFTPLIQRLAQLGRAARITVIMATQCCLASILSSTVKCNFPSRVALRTATAQDSRNIMYKAGAERLPDPITEHRAMCYYVTSAGPTLYDIPMVPETELHRVIEHWERQAS
jgi:S-DNA-T family DNA segregation ATPase FtsK/SpoIIIE